MENNESYKDVHKALIEDEKYQQFMNTIKDEEEKKQLEVFMARFMGYFQEKMFDPLIEKLDKDPEFKDAVYNKLENLLPNNKKEQ
jgi:hypothetical protein